MRPKGKLFALFVIVIAIGLVTATGAFSSVSATRTATVNIAGDSAALLQVQPHNGVNGLNGGSFGSSNGYADIKNSELEINLGGYTSGTADGSGPNNNATTDYRGVFNITNRGTQTVWVNISDDDESTSTTGSVTFYNETFAPINGTYPNYGGLESADAGNGVAVKLDVDETLVVDIQVDTDNPTVSGNLITSVTIYANSDDTVFSATDAGPGG